MGMPACAGFWPVMTAILTSNVLNLGYGAGDYIKLILVALLVSLGTVGVPGTATITTTAVFAASDRTAFGAIEAIKEMKLRVPEDISVIGFDDIEACLYSTPKLTTIRQDCDEIGRRAADILVEEIDGKNKENAFEHYLSV